MEKECMLTTINNPFNPFDQYDEWRRFDEEKGYYSSNRLARILEKNGVSLFDDLSQKEIDEEVERAIDEIVKYDPLDLYKKVTRDAITT